MHPLHLPHLNLLIVQILAHGGQLFLQRACLHYHQLLSRHTYLESQLHHQLRLQQPFPQLSSQHFYLVSPHQCQPQARHWNQLSYRFEQLHVQQHRLPVLLHWSQQRLQYMSGKRLHLNHRNLHLFHQLLHRPLSRHISRERQLLSQLYLLVAIQLFPLLSLQPMCSSSRRRYLQLNLLVHRQHHRHLNQPLYLEKLLLRQLRDQQ